MFQKPWRNTKLSREALVIERNFFGSRGELKKMDCPNGCSIERTVKDKVIKEPLKMEFIRTEFASFNYWHCIKCHYRRSVDKKS